jgi:hypothetical protein
MRILVYKRTHTGDPDEFGRFGIRNCMGRIRSLEYDAVIGIGGRGWEPRQFRIAGKFTWVGVGPRKGELSEDGRGPIVRFDRFSRFDADGPELGAVAPQLAKYMYTRRYKVVDIRVGGVFAEAARLLEWAAPAIDGSSGDSVEPYRKCRPKVPPKVGPCPPRTLKRCRRC